MGWLVIGLELKHRQFVEGPLKHLALTVLLKPIGIGVIGELPQLIFTK